MLTQSGGSRLSYYECTKGGTHYRIARYITKYPHISTHSINLAASAAVGWIDWERLRKILWNLHKRGIIRTYGDYWKWSMKEWVIVEASDLVRLEREWLEAEALDYWQEEQRAKYEAERPLRSARAKEAYAKRKARAAAVHL